MNANGLPGDRMAVSTWHLPEKDRTEIWRDAMIRSAYPVDVEPLPDYELEGRASLFAVGGLVVCNGEVAGAIHKSVDGGKAVDSVLVVLHDSGNAAHTLEGRELTYRPGQAAVLTPALSGEARIRDVRFVSVCFPRQVLAPLVTDIDAATLRPIAPDNDAVQLLRRYLRIVEMDLPGVVTSQLVADHIRDLAALIVGTTQDGRDQATIGGVAAARLAALKAECLVHFTRPDFGIDHLAARSGLSQRSISALFESDGTTFTDFVRAARLERARRLLADPQFDGRGIAMAAYQSGFSDLSYFNRCFRRRYGFTPSDFRASMREGGGA